MDRIIGQFLRKSKANHTSNATKAQNVVFKGPTLIELEEKSTKGHALSGWYFLASDFLRLVRVNNTNQILIC